MQTTPPASTPAPGPSTARAGAVRAAVHAGFRPDIEGLRAVAVILVILNHTIGWPLGGFLGVDVFFVISGFLITGLLMREYSRSGTVSFSGFYVRRALRILPAALLVIVVTVGIAFVLLSQPRAIAVGVSGVFSALFAQNWHLVANGTDYFQATATPSPLEHYWSLAVEEQFYLLWPLLILLLLTLAARQRRGSTARVVVVSLSVIVGLSFLYASAGAFLAPNAAYFDTVGRVWELGAGALIAATATVWHRIPEAIRPLLAWVGLALLIAAAVLVTDRMPLPAPAGALAVLGVALFIVAGTRKNGRPRLLWPVTNPATRYIGRISYSLYLWHFPAIVYLAVVFGADNPLVPALAIGVTLLLSVASYHLVEEPFRTMGGRAAAPAAKVSTAIAAGLNIRKLARGALVVGAACAAALVVVAVIRVAPNPAAQSTVPVASGSGSIASGESLAELTEERTQQIQTALRDSTWPTLTPSVADFGENGRAVIASEWEIDGCLGLDSAQIDDPQQNALRCTFGNSGADASKTAVVYGDSIAISYVPMIRAALGDDWAVKVFTVAGCPASDAPVNRISGGEFTECADFRTWAINEIRATTPAFVFISEATDNSRLLSGATGNAAVAEWTDATRATLEQLKGAETNLVVLNRPSTGVSLYDCQTAVSSPQDCIAPVEGGFERRAVILREVVEEVDPSFSFVNTLSWFCNQGQCPSYVAGTPVLADGIHLTAAAAIAAAPLLAAEVAPLLADDAANPTPAS